MHKGAETEVPTMKDVLLSLTILPSLCSGSGGVRNSSQQIGESASEGQKRIMKHPLPRTGARSGACPGWGVEKYQVYSESRHWVITRDSIFVLRPWL